VHDPARRDLDRNEIACDVNASNENARMTMPAPLVLPPDERTSVRRWILAAAVIVLAHAGIA